ncbi:protein decapping 5 isoform X1 [Ricinus communis]|uniref:protein decapping 5 isoform X1 n=1 Tax=Ricinus communis TaxID=3988 RepID=UPI000772A54E|nr:protein decapping 5 isoform X1 [Ricinus communis]|eukprot:XP_015575135.1 protein decapping 5 [Ricinus communis]
MAVSSSSKAGESYLGSYISLISKYEIRYEGILYHLNVQDSTIALKNVRSYGTEGRKKDGPQIPSTDKVYEFILFRGSDIKDLQVKTAPPAQKEEPVHDDPAIIQSHYAGVPLSSSASASVDGTPFIESAQGQDMPAPNSGAYSTSYPPFQSANHVVSPNLSQATENTAQSFSMPMYWQGYDGTSFNRSYTPQHSLPFQSPPMASSSVLVQNQMQTLGLEVSSVMGLTNATDFVTTVPSATSSLLHTSFSTTPPVQYSVPQEMPSSYLKTSLPSHAAYDSIDRLKPYTVPHSSECTSFINAQSINKDVPDYIPVHSNRSISNAVSPYNASTSSPLLTLTPSLLVPGQLAESTSHVLSSTMYPDQKNMDLLTSLSSISQPLVPTSASQAPLLPLPTSVQKHNQFTMQFTEEFDFEAMNEKFNKEEVWGSLGKPKPTDKPLGKEDNGQSLEDKVAPHLVPNFDPKPAYQKDEFFDTISCNSFGMGRNGQNRFSDRKNPNTETFGWSNQRPNLGYGSYGRGRGDNYRGRHNWGRGYGYGGRGNGNLPF